MHRSASPAPSERGIDIQSGTNIVVTGNRIEDVSGVGLFIQGAVNGVYSDNFIKGYMADPGADNSGIKVQTRDSILPEYLSITGNVVRDFANKGIWLVNMENSVLNGNISKGSDVGLQIDAAADNNIITENIADGVTTNVAYNSGATGNIFKDNKDPGQTGGCRERHDHVTPAEL